MNSSTFSSRKAVGLKAWDSPFSSKVSKRPVRALLYKAKLAQMVILRMRLAQTRPLAMNLAQAGGVEGSVTNI